MMKSKSFVFNRESPRSMPHLRVVGAEQHAKQHIEKVNERKVSNLRRYCTALGVYSCCRQLLDLETELRGTHGQIGEQLVAYEYIAKRLHFRVQQIGAGVGPVTLRRIGEPSARGQTQKRGVQEPDREQADQRGIRALSSLDKPRCLDVSVVIVESGYEIWNGIDPILAIAVDRDDPFIAFQQGPGIATAQLRRQFARPHFRDKGSQADRSQEVFRQ